MSRGGRPVEISAAEFWAKIVVELEPAAWHGSGTETLWAEKVSAGNHRVRNIPFYAYGISLDDVVLADPISGSEGMASFRSVAARGGHSTYRIFLIGRLTHESEALRVHWRPLESLGCSFEGATQVWAFEEAHCGHQTETESEETG